MIEALHAIAADYEANIERLEANEQAIAELEARATAVESAVNDREALRDTIATMSVIIQDYEESSFQVPEFDLVGYGAKAGIGSDGRDVRIVSRAQDAPEAIETIRDGQMLLINAAGEYDLKGYDINLNDAVHFTIHGLQKFWFTGGRMRVKRSNMFILSRFGIIKPHGGDLTYDQIRATDDEAIKKDCLGIQEWNDPECYAYLRYLWLSEASDENFSDLYTNGNEVNVTLEGLRIDRAMKGALIHSGEYDREGGSRNYTITRCHMEGDTRLPFLRKANAHVYLNSFGPYGDYLGEGENVMVASHSTVLAERNAAVKGTTGATHWSGKELVKAHGGAAFRTGSKSQNAVLYSHNNLLLNGATDKGVQLSESEVLNYRPNYAMDTQPMTAALMEQIKQQAGI